MFNKDKARQIISLIDLTSLNESDTSETIQALCEKALTPLGEVAAVCIYPQFVKLASNLLANTTVRIATVVNFPHGTDDIQAVAPVITQAIHDGAHEIDVVFPYERFLAGDTQGASVFIQQCKKSCGRNILLKVILETGALQTSANIAEACEIAILGGADFLKTSTGKISVGATLEAARIMFEAIKKHSLAIGFKASGGIRTVVQAEQYLILAEKILGREWIAPKTFRFGASQLLQEILFDK